MLMPSGKPAILIVRSVFDPNKLAMISAWYFSPTFAAIKLLVFIWGMLCPGEGLGFIVSLPLHFNNWIRIIVGQSGMG